MMEKDLIKLCIDTARGSVEKFSKNEANEVIRKAFVELMGTDKPSYQDFRRHRIDIFEILEETLQVLIEDGWGENPFFQQFVEEKSVAIGDKNEFYVEDRTMLNVSKTAGNHWNLRRQKLDIGESFTVPTFWYGAKIYADFERVIAGRLDWAAFVQKVADAFDYEIKSMTYSSFMTASQYLPTEFKHTGAIDLDKLRTLIEHVQAATGKEVMLVGTKTALGKIDGNIGSNWISENMKDQKNASGIVNDWEGTPLMPLNQVHKKNSFEFKLDNKKILIVPAGIKPVKLVNEGQARIREISDSTQNMDQSVEYDFQMKMGVGVVFNELYGSYTLE